MRVGNPQATPLLLQYQTCLSHPPRTFNQERDRASQRRADLTTSIHGQYPGHHTLRPAHAAPAPAPTPTPTRSRSLCLGFVAWVGVRGGRMHHNVAVLARATALAARCMHMYIVCVCVWCVCVCVRACVRACAGVPARREHDDQERVESSAILCLGTARVRPLSCCVCQRRACVCHRSRFFVLSCYRACG